MKTGFKEWFYNNFCLRAQIKKLTVWNENLMNDLHRQKSINSNGMAENKRLVDRLTEADHKIHELEMKIIELKGKKP